MAKTGAQLRKGLERHGLSDDDLRAINPRLIMCSISLAGQSGPLSQKPGFDYMGAAYGGIAGLAGEPDRGPAQLATAMSDSATGVTAAMAIGFALLHRERTGEATKVDIALFDCQLALLENAIMRYTTTGEIPGPMGARHPSITPFEAFATADGNLIIAAGNDGQFRKLCELLGLAEVPRPADAADALALALCHVAAAPLQARIEAAR